MPTEYKPRDLKLDLLKVDRLRKFSDSDTEEEHPDLLVAAGVMTAYSARTERKMTI